MDADLLSELAQVINLLSEFDVDDQKIHYVTIDKLDENWVAIGIKYHLIRSLIEALKSMRRIGDLKVVVSMRSDLMEKVIHDTRLRTHNQNNTIAARAQADRKMSARLSKRMAILRQSFRRPNMFSIL